MFKKKKITSKEKDKKVTSPALPEKNLEPEAKVEKLPPLVVPEIEKPISSDEAGKPLPIVSDFGIPMRLQKVKPKKIIREVYIVCPECKTDVKGNLLSCPHCKNTRKKLKEWIEEREVE